MMTKLKLAYLAGVMDSDGFFTIKRSTYGIRKIKDRKNPDYFERIGIKQVKPQAIQLIHKNFGGYYRIEKPTAKKGKPLHSISLTNLKAHKFIKAIYPYLLLKKEQANILFVLRKSLKKGKTKPSVALQKCRWGHRIPMKRYSVSDKEIELRETLFNKIKSLNDSRNDITHQPIPWK